METEPVPETTTTLAQLTTDDGKSFPLGELSVVGRSDPARGEVDVDLGGLAEGGYISRAHAEIWTAEGKWFVKDLGSSNGTFIVSGDEKTKVEEDTEITGGQRIAFGTAELTFSTAVEGEAPAEPEVEQETEDA